MPVLCLHYNLTSPFWYSIQKIRMRKERIALARRPKRLKCVEALSNSVEKNLLFDVNVNINTKVSSSTYFNDH